MVKHKFSEFVKHATYQKEVSLVVAKDEAELKELVNVLENQGFKLARNTLDFLDFIDSPLKVFFTVQDTLPKDFYDFIVQYPTGQVEIYDKDKLKSKIVSPNYDIASIILVITKEALKKSQKSGFEIREQVGITYQS